MAELFVHVINHLCGLTIQESQEGDFMAEIIPRWMELIGWSVPIDITDFRLSLRYYRPKSTRSGSYVCHCVGCLAGLKTNNLYRLATNIDRRYWFSTRNNQLRLITWIVGWLVDESHNRYSGNRYQSLVVNMAYVGAGKRTISIPSHGIAVSPRVLWFSLRLAEWKRSVPASQSHPCRPH